MHKSQLGGHFNLLSKPIRIGVDIGGAFTDLVAYNEETGELTWKKVETTPNDPSEGVIEAIVKSGIDISKAYAFIHGQTLVINTILTRSGAKVGLLTTKGFRDVLELQRSNRRDMYNFRYRKPEPFVPRYLRREISERISSDGSVITPLNENELRKEVEVLLREGVESIAISFFNSYANPKHEKEAMYWIKSNYPEIPVTTSYDITREWREYERTSTAVLNAYVKPKMKRYLEKLEKSLKSLGFLGTSYAMLSNGGMGTFSYVAEYPITSVESGPVAGVIGAIQIAKLVGERNIIALDGGSTTTKASLVEGLVPKVTTEYFVERDRWRAGYPIRVPVVETVEVGSGGTSIAWIDEIGNLRVGPKAAGALPGPACYMKGGTEPTVTDAYVVAGILNPSYLLAGELKISREAAIQAVNKIATFFNVSTEEAAWGIIRIANENASNIIRIISIQKGYDPRDFALVAYGGSGPLFAPFIARELEIRKIIVPAIPPGVFSAWGLLATDIRHDAVKTDVVPLVEEKTEKIEESFRELEESLYNIFEQEGLKGREVVIVRNADLRYYGQEHTVKVTLPFKKIEKNDIERIRKIFHEAHRKEYEFSLPDNPIEIVNFHVTGYVIVKKVQLSEIKDTRASTLEEAVSGERKAFVDGETISIPVYYKPLIPPEKDIFGPAIIEDPTSTMLVLREMKVHSDKYGNLIARWLQ
ncbi:MAG: hydantoinase/oxoprolinase family protein [Fervidicoccaceae archaeon]